MLRGADRRGGVQQRVRAAEPRRLLQDLRGAGGRRAARLPQADHARGRRRQHRGARFRQGGAARGRAADPAGRAGHADRHGRRRGVFHGRGREHRGPGFRFGAAGQRGDPAPRAGGDRPLLGAGRGESHPFHPRRGRGRIVERDAGDRARRGARGVPGPARRAFGGFGHVAARDLVQRGAGALRARHRACVARAVPGDVRARALPVRGAGEGDGGRAAEGQGSAARGHAGGRGPADGPRQAAEDAARREAPCARGGCVRARWARV